MIGIRCEAADSLTLREMRPFQGDLKYRTEEQLEELKKSLLDEGLLAPFFIWRGESEGEEGNWLLDGHARYEALRSICSDAGNDSVWLSQEFPVAYIEAESPEEARKALLQITSSYGRVTRLGASRFCASIPEYRAPSVAAFLKPAAVPKERAAPAGKPGPKPGSAGRADEGEARILVSVPKKYEAAVLELFNSVSYIKVL